MAFDDALDGAFVALADAFDFVPAVDGDFVAVVRFAAGFVDVLDLLAFVLVLRVRERGFEPPMGSASPTALTAALAASPTVSATFPAVLRADPAVLPTVFPTVFTTSPGCGIGLVPPTAARSRAGDPATASAVPRQRVSRRAQSQLSLRV